MYKIIILSNIEFQTISVLTESNCKYYNSTNVAETQIATTNSAPQYHSKTHEIKNTVVQDGGGGGGGGTFLFTVCKINAQLSKYFI